MDKTLVFWRMVSVIYWGYVLWYLLNGDVLQDLVLTATGVFAFFTPIPYVVLFGILIYAMLGHRFW